MSTYYLVRQTGVTFDKWRIVTAGQMTRHPRSRLYRTPHGLMGVLTCDVQGEWKPAKTFPPEYKLLGEFPTWEDADYQRQALQEISKVQES